MRFSARSFSDATRRNALAASASGSSKNRGAVPLIGRASNRPPTVRRRNRSGEEQHIWGVPGPRSISAAYGAGLRRRSSVYRARSGTGDTWDEEEEEEEEEEDGGGGGRRRRGVEEESRAGVRVGEGGDEVAWHT